MNPTQWLTRQHDEFRQLFELVRSNARDRALLMPQLIADLRAHVATEDEVFHPVAGGEHHADAACVDALELADSDEALDAALETLCVAFVAEEVQFSALLANLPEGEKRTLLGRMMTQYTTRQSSTFPRARPPVPSEPPHLEPRRKSA